MDSAEGYRLRLADGLTPPLAVTVAQWSDANRILAGKASSEPGPWRTSRTPYLREPMDELSARSRTEEVALMFGAQLGKSEAGNNWLGYLISTEPAPVMAVQPTDGMAKRFSQQRIAPLVQETPVLRDLVAENRSRGDANTQTMKDFPGGVLVIAGANSAAGLRSMPVRYLFLDEIDAYPLDVDGEGDPVELAKKRQSTFARRKTLLTSTPTVEGFSRIEAAYLGSDRRKYWVPCPHCGERQVLKWSGIRWSQDDGKHDPESAAYVCERCGAEIEEHAKGEMLARGEWRAEAATGRVAGFHLSSLYSPLGWVRWADLVREFLAAKAQAARGDVSALKTFVNTRLAETWKEDAESAAKPHELAERAEDYKLRTAPAGALLLVAAVDVQGDRLEAFLWAFGRGEESWVIDARRIDEPPTDDRTWDELAEYLGTSIEHELGGRLAISATAIDSGGHHTQQVYAFAARHRHVLAVKGASVSGKPILGKPSAVQVNAHGRRIASGAKLWIVGTDTAKSLLYGRLRIANPGPGRVHFSKDLDDDFYEQLTAERLVTRYFRGQARLEWVKPPGRRNEALDGAVYALAAAHYAGVNRMRAPDWDAIEARVRSQPAGAHGKSTPAPYVGRDDGFGRDDWNKRL